MEIWAVKKFIQSRFESASFGWTGLVGGSIGAWCSWEASPGWLYHKIPLSPDTRADSYLQKDYLAFQADDKPATR
jgi:hypothetical protein